MPVRYTQQSSRTTFASTERLRQLAGSGVNLAALEPGTQSRQLAIDESLVLACATGHLQVSQFLIDRGASRTAMLRAITAAELKQKAECAQLVRGHLKRASGGEGQ